MTLAIKHPRARTMPQRKDALLPTASAGEGDMKLFKQGGRVRKFADAGIVTGSMQDRADKMVAPQSAPPPQKPSPQQSTSYGSIKNSATADPRTDPKLAAALKARGMKKGGSVDPMDKKEMAFFKSHGAPKSLIKHEEKEMKEEKKYAGGGKIGPDSVGWNPKSEKFAKGGKIGPDPVGWKPGAEKFAKGGMTRSKKAIGEDQMKMAPFKKGGSVNPDVKSFPVKQDGKVPTGPNDKHENELAERGKTRGLEEKMKKGGSVMKYAKGGSVRGDGIAQRGHTRGKNC